MGVQTYAIERAAKLETPHAMRFAIEMLKSDGWGQRNQKIGEIIAAQQRMEWSAKVLIRSLFDRDISSTDLFDASARSALRVQLERLAAAPRVDTPRSTPHQPKVVTAPEKVPTATPAASPAAANPASPVPHNARHSSWILVIAGAAVAFALLLYVWLRK